MRVAPSLVGLLLAGLASCSFPAVTANLREESPPPELGRPAWVTAPANVGSIVGGAVGGIASIVLLPITWPISLLADEPLGHDRDEFLFLPVSIGAGAGHFLFGAPLDTLDWSFRRAWVEDDLDRREVRMQAPPLGPSAYSEPLEEPIEPADPDADPEEETVPLEDREGEGGQAAGERAAGSGAEGR